MASEPDLRAVSAAFESDGVWRGAVPLRSGHIHRTWISSFEQDGQIVRRVHQAINEEIFRDVIGLVRNLERVTRHLRQKADRGDPRRRWEVPQLVATRDGAFLWRDAAGVAWRTWTFVERARTFDVAPSPDVAREAARAFGRFARDLVDFDGSELIETIPRFHDLEGRLARLSGVVERDPVGRRGRVRREIDRIAEAEGIAKSFAELRARGGIPLRVVHNDTKVNNVMIDEETGVGVAVVDLDTVMPGSLLFDYGDLVRTATCPAPEDEPDSSRVRIDEDLFGAVTEGYVREVASFATTTELEHLLLGARFMVLILAVRFLTDYLEGDRYFRIVRPEQNLDRARVQLALLASLETRADRLTDRIGRVRRS